LKWLSVAGLVSALVLTAHSPLSADPRKLVSFGSDWRYDDKGEDLGTKWREPKYDYSHWPRKKARFGYGAPDIKTQLSYGSDPKKRHITYYFRKYITLGDVPKDSELTLHIRYDDGFAFYINGQLVASGNMPEKFDCHTCALRDHDSKVVEVFEQIPTDVLVPGKNFLAVEVHQNSPSSGDMAFDMELSISPISDRLRIKPTVRAPAIKEWLVSDVFQNDDQGSRLKKDYLGSEAQMLPDPSTRVGGKVWKAYSRDDGMYDFEKGEFHFRDRTNIAVYAHVYVHSPIEQGVVFYIGSDDGCATWVNGSRVHFNDIYRGLVEDKDEVPVHLLSGWNRVLMKVSQGGGAWKMKVKIATIDGEAVPGLKYSVKNPLTPQQWQAQRPSSKMDIMPGKTMAYVNNGRLALWFGQSQDSMLNVVLNGRRAGSMRAALAQFEKKGTGYKKTGVGWAEANQVVNIEIDSKRSDLCVVDVTVERTESRETQRKYQATYQFRIPLNTPWFESRFLSLKNTDGIEYEVRGYWHKLQPPVSDAEPHCHDWIAAWVSAAGGIGAMSRNGSDYTLALRSREGRPHGDITRSFVRKVGPGFEAFAKDPGLIIFVAEKGLPEDVLKGGLRIKAADTARAEAPNPMIAGQ